MGGSSKGSSTNTTVNYSPEEAAARSRVQSEAERIYAATGAQMANAPYPGAKPVDFDPNTLAAQQGLQSAAGAVQPGIQNLMNSVNFSLRDVLYPESNPALQQTINASIRPITESYMDPGGIMSQIRTQAGQEGQVGSSRQGIAEGIAAGRYADAIGDTAAKVSTAGYSQGLDAMSRAQALAPQAMQTMTLPSQWLSAIGGQREGLQSQWNQYGADQAMWGLNAPWQSLQNYANIVYGGASPGTSTTSTAPQASMGQRLIGGAATGLGTYAALAGTGYGLPAAIALGLGSALFS